jgi:putative intracellular protease/amidase
LGCTIYEKNADLEGFSGASVKQNETLDWILSTAGQAGAAIGGICAGPLLLAKASLLKGKRLTHGDSSTTRISNRLIGKAAVSKTRWWWMARAAYNNMV